MSRKISNFVISKVVRIAAGNLPPSICYGFKNGSEGNCICDCSVKCKFTPGSSYYKYSYNTHANDGVFDANWPIKSIPLS